MKKIIILGGGTFSPIRNHLSLCAPAFGTTAKYLYENINKKINKDKYKTELYLTKMADYNSNLKTNEDVSILIQSFINDPDVKTIILNVAFCDFYADIENKGFHGDRLKTSDGDLNLTLKPYEKIIDQIRIQRPDIFLVGFKTTTNATIEEQFLTALKMMKRSKCNLVLANDIVTRHNMIITPEETKYEAGDRKSVLDDLIEVTLARHDLTYTNTNFIEGGNIPFSSAPESFKEIINYLIDNGGFIENNGNGFTPGHFCYKLADNLFVSSQRKVNHNKVIENGMTLVKVDNINGEDKFTAIGTHKPSVGARSQWLLLNSHKEFDCIVHTHTPVKSGQLVNKASQKPFQCGSFECGMNTVNNLNEVKMTCGDSYARIMYVMLDKHGPNILFRSKDNPNLIIDFISKTFDLGKKII